MRLWNFFEFHKPYFSTNKRILGNLPRIFISSIVQFVSFTKEDCKNLKSKLNKFILFDEEHKVSKWISKIILKSIFDEHVRYNGSLFSEFELIGMCKLLFSAKKQIPINTIRNGLDGKLTKFQIKICKIFDIKHVTYEHGHPTKYSKGMLDRKQTYSRFYLILIKQTVKFFLRFLRYNFKNSF